MPPLSGFLGKLMLMQSLAPALTGAGLAWAFWGALLLSGFVAALVLARAASAFFWEPGRQGDDGDDIPLASRSGFGSVLAVVLLTAASPLLTLAATPVAGYARAAAEQLHARMPYVSAVLGTQPSIERELRP
jgi:multicomponent K+:H+ antiporter subunit D